MTRAQGSTPRLLCSNSHLDSHILFLHGRNRTLCLFFIFRSIQRGKEHNFQLSMNPFLGLSALSRILKHCGGLGRRVVGSSMVDHVHAKGSKFNPKQRVLTEQEKNFVWKAYSTSHRSESNGSWQNTWSGIRQVSAVRQSARPIQLPHRPAFIHKMAQKMFGSPLFDYALEGKVHNGGQAIVPSSLLSTSEDLTEEQYQGFPKI